MSILLIVRIDDSYCQDLLFAQRAGSDSQGSSGDEGNSIATDASGNVFVTGTMNSGTSGAVFGQGQINETALLINGGFIAKYDNFGELQWVQQMGSSNNSVTPYAVDVDASGYVYISGTFFQEATFGLGQTNQITLSGTSGEMFLAKYDSDGQLQWAINEGGAEDDNPGGRGIVVSDAGSIYVVGTFWNTVTFAQGEPNETTLVGENTDIFLASYDTNGNLQWIEQAGGSGFDGGTSIDLDVSGNIYIIGDYVGPAVFGGGSPNETTLNEINSSSFFAKYLSNGDFQWAKDAFQTGTTSTSGDIKVDKNGDLLFAGQFANTITLGLGESSQTQLSGSGADEILLAKYASDGTFIWGKTALSSGDDRGLSLDTDQSANVYVTGYYGASIQFGSGEVNDTTISNAGNGDLFLAKYSNTGEFQWVTSAGSSEWEQGTDVVVNNSDIFVTGFYRGNITLGTGEPNETTLNISGFNDIYVAKFQKNSELTFEEVLAGTFTSITSNSDMEAADYDNDGDYDILLTGWVGTVGTTELYDNNGDATFTLNTSVPFIDVYRSSVEWFDYNSDGHLDVLIMGNSGDEDIHNSVTKVYENDGLGGFTEVLSGAFINLISGDVEAGDYNNDGLPDLLFQGEWIDSGTTIEVVTKLYTNKGADGFLEVNSPSPSPIYLEASFQGAVSWSDYDNDEDLDFYLSGSGNGYLAKLFVNENGSFREVSSGTFEGVNSSDVITVDLDNNGFEDVLFAGQETGNTTVSSKIYSNNGGVFSVVAPGSIEDILDASLATGDLDGDGNADIMATGTAGYMGPEHTSLYSGNGDLTISQIALGEVRPALWGSIDPIDYDGDSDLDIFLIGSGTSLYRNNSNVNNAKPGNPSNLTVEVFSQSIKIDWEAAIDVETPSMGLSYDIYLTDLSTGNMIIASPSDTTNGFRRVLKKGNIKTTSWRLKRSLPAGNYRVGVQAVDASLAGGNFATVDFVVPSGNIDDGLAAYYPFNGNANDESGNGRDGDPDVASLTEDRFGNSNSAYQFGNSDQIILGRNELFSQFDGFTVSGWMKPQVGGGNTQYILQGSQVEILFFQDSKNFQYNINSSIGGLGLDVDMTGINFDEWTFFAATYDNTMANFYVNGNLIESFTLADIDLDLQERGINIGGGGLANSNGLNFNGALDEIRIYNRALSGQEVMDSYNADNSQIPSIASFTPGSGPVGTEVVITGTNFDSTPENNIVFFGATQATVLTSSTNELTVTVPAGATYEPISVLTSGLIAYSSEPFVVAFGGDGIDIDSFVDKVDFALEDAPISIAVADLDGDGKTDLVAGTDFDGKVSILRNTSTGASNFSFAEKIQLFIGTDPLSIDIGDLDGDGKPELVIIDAGLDSFSVLLNGSSSGVISFPAKLDFGTGLLPSYISIGDVDSDGKADLAITNFTDNTISIHRNTSTGVGNISFAEKIDFPTGSDPRWVAISDLNGDRKPDLAVATDDNTVSVLRNTSSGPGVISYAAKVHFDLGEMPSSLAVGDLNTDGREDLAIVNTNSHTISLLRNISISGATIDFVPREDYATGAFPVAVSLNDFDGDGKIDLGVANRNNATLSIFKNTSENNGNITLGPKVDFTTGMTPIALSAGDLDNDGKPDLIVANNGDNTISLFRNDVTGSGTRIIRLEGDMNFGNVEVNTLANRTLTIHNDGNSILTLNNLSFNGVPQFVNDASTLVNDLQVAPSSSTNVSITFTPTDAQSYQTTLTVNSDKTSGDNSIILSGSGTAGPVAYYPFNGNANDESGNDNDGTIIGATFANDRFSNSNQALQLSGNEYVQINDHPSLNFGVDNFTLSIWMKTDDKSNYAALINKGEGTQVEPRIFIRLQNPVQEGNFGWRIGDGSTNIDDNITLNPSISDTQWHHIVLVRNGDDLSFYVDATLVKEKTSSNIGVNNFNSSRPLLIGAQDSVITTDIQPMANFFNGSLDDIRIYDRALTDQEINSLATEGGWIINAPPTSILLSNNSISENEAINSVIGSLSTTDPNSGDTHTYSLVAGTGDADNASFKILNTNQLATNEVFDFETKSSYSIRVQTDDGNGGTFSDSFTIDVIDVDEGGGNSAPTDISLSNNSIAEDSPISTQIGILSTTDPDNSDTHTYSLISGDVVAFNINNINVLESAQVFDADVKSSYTIIIRSTDAGGLSFDKEFAITVMKENNNPPSAIHLSNNILRSQSSSIGMTVGSFMTEDADVGDTFTYTLVEGTGDDDNDKFAIAGSRLNLASDIGVGSYSIRAQSSDGVDSIVDVFTITVVSIPTSTVLKTGNSVSDYRIFGVPADNVTVNQFFPDLTSSTQGTSWRITSYSNGATTDLNRSSTLIGGRGYWFLSTAATSESTFSLTPVTLNGDAEFGLNLNSGWNLISNPFYSELNLADAIALNESRGVITEGDVTPAGVYTYNGSYNISSNLNVLQGGWVFSSVATTLMIPNPSSSLGGRTGESDQFSLQNSWFRDTGNWQLIIEVKNDEIISNLGGIGMRSGASDQRDRFDLQAPPPISIDAAFSLRDDHGLSRNFARSGNEKEWTFQINAPRYEKVTLSWDKLLVEKLPRNLYVYVSGLNKTFNMQAISEITVPVSSTLNIVYGEAIDRSTLDIHAIAYPNPSEDEVYFKFFVDGTDNQYEVSILIYGVDGQLVYKDSEIKQSNQSGIIQVADLDLPSGLYLYQVNYDNRTSQLKKLLIK